MVNTGADPLAGKNVGVIGFARQGKALARWLPTIGANAIVADSKTAEQLQLNEADYPGVEFVLGGRIDGFLNRVAVLCLSGGVPLELPAVQEAIRRGIPLANDAQLFLERCPAPVLGITGSAGKTTTTTLTGEMLKQAGKKTWVGGNIGDVLLDVLADIQPTDRVVMELSSFQLELMTRSPQVGAVTNITPNHLDRHGTMEAYTEAKANILRYQQEDSVAVLGLDDPGSRALEGYGTGDLAWFSAQTMAADGAFLVGSRLVVSGVSSPDGNPHVIGEKSAIQLRGDHNVLNVLAACAISGIGGATPEAMFNVMSTFKGVAHRLEVVRIVRDVTYINDSIATAPERVVAALHSFREPLVLLAGGRDKKLPWGDMMALALAQSRQIIAFGEAGEIVERVAGEQGQADRVTRVATLDEAVPLAASLAQPGDVVLLSPGGTSYDAYVDFAARGEHFRQLVQGL